MKKLFLFLAAIVIACGITFAMFPSDPKIVPPISLPDAYLKAMNALGSATNGLHCTTARFLGPTLWRFTFWDTNASPTTVDVFTNFCQVTKGMPPE